VRVVDDEASDDGGDDGGAENPITTDSSAIE
jgi:hypothetical protein